MPLQEIDELSKDPGINTRICGKMERFIQPCLLLLFMRKSPGYELLEDLVDFGFEQGPIRGWYTAT